MCVHAQLPKVVKKINCNVRIYLLIPINEQCPIIAVHSEKIKSRLLLSYHWTSM